jgi:diguanylate cyclase (GGDEF)-like protein/PAS domain S-box-containing protein
MVETNFFANNEIYNTMLKFTDDEVFISDIKRNVTKVSPEFAAEYSLPGDVIYDFNSIWFEKIHPDEQRMFIDNHRKLQNGEIDCLSEEYRVRNSDGEWVWVSCRGSLVDSESNQMIFIGNFQNLSKRNKVDMKTGLLNKSEFELMINTAIKNREEFTAGVANFDDFQRINELYDREFGDEIMRISAQYVQNVLGEKANVFKLDNDELGIFTKCTSKSTIEKAYDDIRNHFMSQLVHKGRQYMCTVSFGCCVFDNVYGSKDDIKDFGDIIRNAGLALSFAKEHGKNRIVFYTKKIGSEKIRKTEITEEMFDDVQNGFNDFEVFCQPILNGKGTLVGGEALLRWSCFKYGSVSPSEFIPILEETNLIISVGKFVFETAVKQCKIWQNFLPDFQMSVNISYLQLFDANFVDYIKDTIEKNKMRYNSFIFELSESCFFTDREMLRSIFAELRELGVEVALDEFGSGNFALDMLRDIPADIIKIDRSFVRNINGGEFDLSFIEFITGLFHKLGLKVCALGIESDEELAKLKDLNLDFIQGYLFGEPQSEKNFHINFLS